MPSLAGVIADCAGGGGGEGGGGGLSLVSLLKPKNNAASSACSALRRIGGLGSWVSGWARHLCPAGRALLRGRKPFAAAFRQSEGTVSSPRPRRRFPSIQIAHTHFGARDILLAVRHKPWLVRGHVTARSRSRTGGIHNVSSIEQGITLIHRNRSLAPPAALATEWCSGDSARPWRPSVLAAAPPPHVRRSQQARINWIRATLESTYEQIARFLSQPHHRWTQI